MHMGVMIAPVCRSVFVVVVVAGAEVDFWAAERRSSLAARDSC